MKTRYRNVSFLAEVLVNIMVFSISCAILVGAFAGASVLVRETREESLATNEIYSILETVKLRGEGALDGAEALPDGNYRLEYDKGWQPAAPGTGVFYITVSLSLQEYAGGTLQTVEAIAYRQDSEEICRFDTAVYLPEGGAAA